jgi:ABC-type lipoprotein release transport system permease subunit
MPLRRRTTGVRVRTTIVAVLAVGAALVVTAVIMEVRLRNTLTSDIEDAAQLTAQAIAGAIEHGSIPPTIETGDADEEFIQVMDPAGVVISATENLSGRTPVVTDLENDEGVVVEGLPFEDGDGRFIVVAKTAPTDQGPHTVVVGRALEEVSDATNESGRSRGPSWGERWLPWSRSAARWRRSPAISCPDGSPCLLPTTRSPISRRR